MFTLFKSKVNFFSSTTIADITENFNHPDYNLLLLKRPVNADILHYIQFLYASPFRKIEFHLDKDLLNEQIFSDLKDLLPFADLISEKPLLNDLFFLAENFMELAKVSKLRLHLRVITDDACRKFHVDGYENRCICTYDGLGTEWLMDDNVRRKALGTENEQIVKNQDGVQKMNPFEVGFLKGENFKNPSGKGVIHRSPEIESKGLKRFVVRLDV